MQTLLRFDATNLSFVLVQHVTGVNENRLVFKRCIEFLEKEIVTNRFVATEALQTVVLNEVLKVSATPIGMELKILTSI